MALLTFMGEHPFLTWCLAWGIWVVPYVVFIIVGAAAALPLEIARHLMAAGKPRFRGWPPPHIDAESDGDWKPRSREQRW